LLIRLHHPTRLAYLDRMSENREQRLGSPIWALGYVVIAALVGGLLVGLGSGAVEVVGFVVLAVAGLLAQWAVIASGVEYGLRRVRDL